MVDLENFILNSYGKPLPVVNKSEYSILPQLLKEKLESKDFEKEIKSRFRSELLVEEELKTKLWVA